MQLHPLPACLIEIQQKAAKRNINHPFLLIGLVTECEQNRATCFKTPIMYFVIGGYEYSNKNTQVRIATFATEERMRTHHV